jgi:hypothetical protein
MDATYVSTTSFTVVGNQASIFLTERRVKCDCGVDGYKYGTINTSAYTTLTTVTLKDADSDDLTDNLTSVEWSAVTPTSAPDSTYTKIVRVTASKLGKNVTNPPIVAEYGITHALKFTVNTDKAHYKQAVESDYAGGDINVHFHWTKSTINSDQSTKNVKWQLKYLVINGTSENCNSGESTDSIGDTYDSAVNATQIICKTGDITIPNGIFEIHDMIIMEVMAVTPTPDALSDEPALIYLDIVYTAKHRS